MPATESTKRRRQTVPKLKESCDCCAAAKVRCSREQPSCLRCRQRGFHCEYSISRRAGRQTRTISTDMTRPRHPSSSSSTSSYTGSPLTSPTIPHYPVRPRQNTSDSSDSDSSFFSTSLGGPVVPQQILSYGTQIEPQTLQQAWDHPAPSFLDTESPESMGVNCEWGHLRNSFTFNTDPTEPPPTLPPHHHPYHHHHASSSSSTTTTTSSSSVFEPSSPTTAESSSIVGSIEMSPRQLQLDIAHLQQESYLFLETEAIKEELNLAANFIRTLEDRIDKGIGCYEVSSNSTTSTASTTAATATKNPFTQLPQQQQQQTLTPDCGAGAGANVAVGSLPLTQDSSHLVAYHFTAVDLRRRLHAIRREIECIAGLGC